MAQSDRARKSTPGNHLPSKRGIAAGMSAGKIYLLIYQLTPHSCHSDPEERIPVVPHPKRSGAPSMALERHGWESKPPAPPRRTAAGCPILSRSDGWVSFAPATTAAKPSPHPGGEAPLEYHAPKRIVSQPPQARFRGQSSESRSTRRERVHCTVRAK